jgi:hypothetical protein
VLHFAFQHYKTGDKQAKPAYNSKLEEKPNNPEPK